MPGHVCARLAAGTSGVTGLAGAAGAMYTVIPPHGRFCTPRAKACANAAAVGKRLAGSFSNAFRIAAAAGYGRSGRTVWGEAGASLTCLLIMETQSVVSNATRPVTIS